MFKRWAGFIIILTMVLSFTMVFADAPKATQVSNANSGGISILSRYIIQD